MCSKINYEKLNNKYIDQAVDLVLASYNKEKNTIPFLPYEKEVKKHLKESMENLFDKGTGIMATCNDRLIGYIAGYKANELFGKEKGVYCPLYGNAVSKEYGASLYKQLYKHIADIWVKEGFMSHALTLFAHDKETIDTWFWLGFGLRCVDSIKEVKSIDLNKTAIEVSKADIKDISFLKDIHRKHNEYYRTSPIFMPTEDEDPIDDLTKWLNNDNHHLWVAYDNKKPIGYMRIQPSGETFISKHKDMMNITGAYVISDRRKSGVGVILLSEIQKWLKDNNYSLCGVDFESINITGSSFWNKHFTPYTYSVVRRIDERITM